MNIASWGVRHRGLVSSREGRHALAHGRTGARTDVDSGERPRSARTPALQAELDRGRAALRSLCRRMRDATSCGIASTGAPACGGVAGGVGSVFAPCGGVVASRSARAEKAFDGMGIGTEGRWAGEGEGGGVGRPGMPSTRGSD